MLNNFVTEIDNRFYKHLYTKSHLPLHKIPEKSKFLENLRKQVICKNYHPQTPRAYVVQGKEHLISRITPILQIQDACVYYYCIKQIEGYLAKTRVEGTFGGFSMGGVIRNLEENEFVNVSELESASSYPYNPISWSKEWGGFSK